MFNQKISKIRRWTLFLIEHWLAQERMPEAIQSFYARPVKPLGSSHKLVLSKTNKKEKPQRISLASLVAKLAALSSEALGLGFQSTAYYS